MKNPATGLEPKVWRAIFVRCVLRQGEKARELKRRLELKNQTFGISFDNVYFG
jgi:hypothetical protein